ncbi:hypothetical protein [Pseudobacteriovorax antillogorgiicola]|uniref:YtkA-like n=1 Tax=Pseudobacteriovorax antillogorgiicola TaxID=1513793 RepID=A0A1Y6BU57_9BACT|nr:hypothetical protein [Pseudobacteriovorax antillogorgiicola]TCS52435.1 hypothetical protein EDD56_109180 [Pseudobacteriovorax antillogorgiicola]SMF28706.1 hypothetical protein SAMN06296036_10933 [Pseudobacteriovorax antillogorgiicola]
MKIITLLMTALLFTACNESSDDNSMGDGAQMDHDHSAHDHGDHNMEGGELSDQVASLSSGYQAKGAWQSETLVAGDQTHELMVSFFDSEGAMLHNVTITEVTPWMQVHGHGSNDDELMFQQHDDMGQMWMIMGIKFSMAGSAGDWIIKVKFTVDGTEDEVHLPVIQDVTQ